MACLKNENHKNGILAENIVISNVILQGFSVIERIKCHGIDLKILDNRNQKEYLLEIKSCMTYSRFAISHKQLNECEIYAFTVKYNYGYSNVYYVLTKNIKKLIHSNNCNYSHLSLKQIQQYSKLKIRDLKL